MKTREELRAELEKLRKKDFDACLDFSNKIKPLEEQLSAAERGDILFSNTRVRAKIEKLNKLFQEKGYPLFIARKSDYEMGWVEDSDWFADFAQDFKNDDDGFEYSSYYKSLGLYLSRGYYSQLVYSFEEVSDIKVLLSQLSLLESQIELLGILCSLYMKNGIYFEFKGFLGTCITLRYLQAKIQIDYNTSTNSYDIEITYIGDLPCDLEVIVPFKQASSYVVQVGFNELKGVQLKTTKESVKSKDLQTVLDNLIESLIQFDTADIKLVLKEEG
jgi:hypothetical protein